jgi:hypothetical protein
MTKDNTMNTEQKRIEFEAWYRSYYVLTKCLDTWNGWHYADENTQVAFSSYQAALATKSVPDGWMRDREQVVKLAEHLENIAWQPDGNGDPECVHQDAAMSADVIRKVLLPILDATPQPPDDRARELEKDAARYKWIINNPEIAEHLIENIGPAYWSVEIDNAIDQAMKEANQ